MNKYSSKFKNGRVQSSTSIKIKIAQLETTSGLSALQISSINCNTTKYNNLTVYKVKLDHLFAFQISCMNTS